MKTPVLFIVFNRPETTRQVFAAICAARPERLYVAADGARAGREGEVALVERARAIATAVDWPCRLATLFRDENLGCRRAVSGAVDWLFANEAEGIILEDDTVPLPSFFAFAESLLEKYRDDERVMMINGANLISHRYASRHSYHFSAYAHIWGWASWRRAWAYYDPSIEDWPALREAGAFAEIPAGRQVAWKRHWHGVFDATHAGQVDTWDYQLSYALFKRQALAVVPRTSLVNNIGHGQGATHTDETVPDYVRKARLCDLTFPLDHPAEVRRDLRADRIEEKTLFTASPMLQAVQRVFRAPALAPLYRVARALRDRYTGFRDRIGA